MALKDQITAAEILGRIPDDLEPADLTNTIVEAIRDQVAGYLEDISGTTFGAGTTFLNTAKHTCIGYAAVYCVIYAGANPEANASFSPDGELKVSLAALPKSIATFVNATLMLCKPGFDVMLNINPNNVPTSNITVFEG